MGWQCAAPGSPEAPKTAPKHSRHTVRYSTAQHGTARQPSIYKALCHQINSINTINPSQKPTAPHATISLTTNHSTDRVRTQNKLRNPWVEQDGIDRQTD